jgi:uncharacterized membrane protein YuzA (DUF378 family)
MKELYEEKKYDKFVRATLVAGGIVHMINALSNTNVIANFAGNNITRVIYLLFGVAALMVMFERDYYLPFLDDCVFPSGLLGDRVSPQQADTMATVNVPPKTKVVYWASESCDNCPPLMAWDAYGKYTNSGVTTSDVKGVARLMVRSPQSYNIPYKDDKLKPHVHYRYLLADGMFSRIHTAQL